MIILFNDGSLFREWLLTKIVNGERASYSAPKFARMQERTRSQMLEDIVANLQNHAETGQIPKPYRRGRCTNISRPISSAPTSERENFNLSILRSQNKLVLLFLKDLLNLSATIY